MKYDSYTRFLKSQMYKDCIVYEMEQKPLNQLINIFTSTSTSSTSSSSTANSITTSLTNNNNNLNNVVAATSATAANEANRKDKKRSVILPWTKGMLSLF